MKKEYRVSPGILLVLLILAASGCDNNSPAAHSEASTPVTTRVKVGKPQRTTLLQTIEQPGQIVAIEHAPIYARIPGYVGEVCVDMNATVKKDQVLIKLSVPELEQETRQKAALVEQAKSVLTQAEASADASAASVDAAQALIVEAQSDLNRVQAELDFRKVEYDRYVRLHKDNAIRSDLVDEKLNQYRAAEAALASANARISTTRANLKVEQAKWIKAKADVENARTTILVAESNLEQARIMLAYRDIVAPFDGIVTQRNVHTGHLIRPAPSGNSEPLMVLVRNDRVRVFVEVPEKDAALILTQSENRDQATAVSLRVQALNHKEVIGKVTRGSWTLDPTNRTLRVEIELSTSETGFRPGMYVYARFKVSHKDVWCLPLASIISRDSGTYCYRVEDGKALLTPIRIGVRNLDKVQVLKKNMQSTSETWDDFTGTEQVVIDNPGTLSNGQTIDVSATGE